MAMRDRVVDELLAEQVRYYRARAPEYDATSPPVAPEAVAALRALGPVHRAIELGAGTGQITGILAGIAGEVLAVDSSPEVLELNRSKVRAPNVRRVVADVFGWTSPWAADLVLFAALLSHIPSDRFDDFWAAIDRMLVPGGRVFVLDEAPHVLWGEEREPDAGAEVVTRTLNDGRRFRIVKVLWEPADLEARLAELGWAGRFARQDPFYWGVVERSVAGD
jgi:demethylmenaquinone methyltransferase/2-methoxy-6-polyprenyl-1,4-benzoquinol methylase